MANSTLEVGDGAKPPANTAEAPGPATPRGHRNSNADWEFPFPTPGRWKGRKRIPANTEKRQPWVDMDAYDAVKIPARHVKSPVSMAEFKQSMLALGVDDVGVISFDHPALAHELDEIRYVYPHARSLVIMVGEENKPSLQSRYLPTANHELYHCEERLFQWGQSALKYLRTLGAEGLTTTVGWPQEMSQRWPDKIWPLSHKLVAQAAGLGVIGTSRNFLHKKFGAYCLLDTVLTNIEFESWEYEGAHKPFDWNPCLECNLCVASCPTSAIKGNGEFDFLACYNHTYRDSAPGFVDLVRDLAEGKPARFEDRWTDGELGAIWQSMAFKVEYRCFNCVATCPAEIHWAYHNEKGVRGNYLKDVLKPLTHTRFDVEERFVIDTPSARETYDIPPGNYRTPIDITRPGHGGMVRLVPLHRTRTSNIDAMMRLMPYYFRAEEAVGLDFTAQIELSGPGGGTWVLRVVDERCSVSPGTAETTDLTVRCSGAVFLAIHRGEASPVLALLLGRVRLKGRKALFVTFGRLFPGRIPSSVFHRVLWYAQRAWKRWRASRNKSPVTKVIGRSTSSKTGTGG